MCKKTNDSLDFWVKLMHIGGRIGCHQRADRSFFYKGYQFPVCARCTGVIIGYIASVITIAFILPDLLLGLIFCGIMFIDWFIQFVKIKESTNIRRLITGVLGGYGIVVCEFNILLILLMLIDKWI